MKYCSLALALATIAPTAASFAGEAPVSAPAPAPVVSSMPSVDSAWFVGVKGSALWLEDIGYSVGTVFGDLEIDSNFKTGWGVTVPFGYRFSNGLSLGASVGYYTADLDNVTVKLDGDTLGDIDLDADPSLVPMLLNVAYSFRLTDALSLNLGAGAGVAWHEFDLDEIAGIDYDASSDGWDFSFQAFGGFNYSISANTDLTLGYRYVQTDTDVDTLHGHNVEAGFVVRF